METITDIKRLRQALSGHESVHQHIALVPTMGNLHQGHLNLVSEAVATSDVVVASIFVNPLQFGPEEDLASYPRSPERDTELLENAGCHYLFKPDITELYGTDLTRQTVVHVPGISENFCGASRPGHFDGVATVIARLFNIVRPASAFFGLKDYQQFLVIRQLVKDLQFPVEIVGVEIARAASGLALSSRNNYLDAGQTAIAANLHRILSSCAADIEQGAGDYPMLAARSLENLRAAGLKPDYFAICDAENLQPASGETTALVILAAATIGNTRLIDNVRLQTATPCTPCAPDQ